MSAGPRLSRRARRRRRRLTLAAATAAALLVAVGLQLAGAIERIELQTVDARFEVRGTRAAAPDVIVVGVDDRTFDGRGDGGIGVRWPFPRRYHAQVIRRLTRDGAKVIAYDVQFTEQSPPGQEDQDAALVEAIARADEMGTRVALATTEVDAKGGTRVLGGDATVNAVGARVGNAVTPGDRGSVVRRVQLEQDGLRSFSVVSAERALGRPASPRDFPDGGAWIAFRGPPGTTRSLSFADVYYNRFKPGTFRDKVVVVGAVAPVLQDNVPTSTSGDGQMPGPELQAETIQTIIDGFPLRGPGPWLAIVLMVAFALVPPLIASAPQRVPPLASFAMAIALGLAYLLAAQIAFANDLMLPIAAPLIGLALSAVATLVVVVLSEAFERRRIHDLFAHFVPEAVVDQVVRNADENLRLGGEHRVATVMFSDLRGFTTYSESRPPDEVIGVLNAYLGEMTDAIMDAGGTLVSYMGDGIMAVFGAPLDQPDHADRALSAAREMLARLARFNVRMGTPEDPEPFLMGVGLNTGMVISGNVGSERRLEYAAIGDTTNTASRIEGMTKGTAHSVFLSDSTYDALSDKPEDVVLFGEMPVRGRAGTVRLWGLVRERPGTSSPPAAESRSPASA